MEDSSILSKVPMEFPVLDPEYKTNGASSIQTNIKNDESPENKLRHCARCLKVCGLPTKLCGKCKKRAYCCKECQSADWPIRGNGQAHVNWCGRYECGEEDIDWHVVPVPKKGLGIRAKRLIPAGYRIIVEPVFTNPNDHTGIMDLAPEGASLMEKFDLNQVEGDEDRDGGKPFVGLRLARVNHDCKPNAAHVYDEVARVIVLYALRDIEHNEEICITYANFANLSPKRPNAVHSSEKEFKLIQLTLQDSWGVTCPDDCYCKDTEARKLVLEGRRLFVELHNWFSRGVTEKSLVVGEKILEIQRQLNVSWFKRGLMYNDLFTIAVMNKKTLHRAEGYIRAALDIFRNVCPYSKITEKCERRLKHPELEVNYLKMEWN